MNEVRETIKKAASELFDVDVEPEISRPEEQFGDYASNVAMQLAPKLGKSPREIADVLKKKLDELGYYEKVEIAGPGFINITLKQKDILSMAQSATNLPKPLNGQEILVEFGDPNPFKEMHIGHLYSYIVGDSISRLLEANGATVKRLSYHGDVGLHVAKAIWGMQHSELDFNATADAIRQHIGMFYAKGAQAYEENEQSKSEIEAINHHIYKRDNEDINKLYDWGKEKSFGYFDSVLNDIDVKTDRIYLESKSSEKGVESVRQHLGTVFKESQGAIIYDGEKVGLHTRVFITSKGLPTYETKDLGLAELKNDDYPTASRSVIITANEQAEYFKVMLAALKEFDEPLASKTTHLTHGFVSLSGGKMSSRTGEVYGAVNLIVDVEQSEKEKFGKSSPTTRNAAIKYVFLNHRLGGDIVYDVSESVSLEGNSGPYLQYAHARAASILQKASDQDSKITDLDEGERSLARKISEYPEVVAKATEELMPHYVANYLYELAQNFNRFYEHNRVIGDPREATRLGLVKIYKDVLKSGLSILNISAPEHV